jgi:hypothetical protein
MEKRYVVYALVLIATFALGALCGDALRTPAMAQGDEVKDLTAPTRSEVKSGPPQVVTAVPYETETRYDMDPFEQNRVRSTIQKVQRVILIRSDGTTEIVVAE